MCVYLFKCAYVFMSVLVLVLVCVCVCASLGVHGYIGVKFCAGEEARRCWIHFNWSYGHVQDAWLEVQSSCLHSKHF